MAVRRMLHADVIQSDSFLSLPFSAQMLYVQITMKADDDGFLNGAESLCRFIGAKKPDLRLLIEKRFLLAFDGVVVVKHWRVANSLKNDRLKPVRYPEIAEKIYIKPNRAYTDHPVAGAQNLLEARQKKQAERNPNGIPVEGKVREDKIKEDKIVEVEGDGIPTTASAEIENLKKMGGSLGKGLLMLTDAQTADLLDRMGLDCFDHYADKISRFLQKGGYVKNHYDTMLKWWKEDRKL